MILKLSLYLPNDQSFVPLARRFGRCLLEYMKVVEEDIGDVEAILTELATNVVRHANSQGGRYQVLLEYFDDRMAITVVDTGNGFAFRDIPEVGSARSDSDGGQRIGGYGMLILNGLSDRLNFSRTDPQGTTVCAEKSLRYTSQQALEDAEDMNKSGGLVTFSAD